MFLKSIFTIKMLSSKVRDKTIATLTESDLNFKNLFD